MNTFFWRNGWFVLLSLAIAVALLSLPALGADKARPPADPAQTVEMFQAIDQGDIAVKLIPKNSKESNVRIENKTKRPLTVKLPEAFAGVPVLAQVGGAVAGGGRQAQAQPFGGGFGMGGFPGMGGMGMGMFNIPPEKVGQFKVTTVCLEHGKAEPQASIPYAIKPLESVTDKPGVRELCQMLGNGQIDQRSAQAAAWNLNNNMSWQQLAAKQLKHANGTAEPYFRPWEIQRGVQAAAVALKQAEARKAATPESGQSTSAN